MKKITALFALLMLVCMGATAQVYVTETGQNMLTADQMKAGVDAGDFYVSMQQHQTSTHNYINSQGKLQNSYNTNGTTAWKVEKKGSNYVLKSVATGKYISSLASSNGTAAGFSDNFDDALEFAPVQSTSTDGNVASGYATSQSIWWNIASNPSNRLNTSGSSNIFQNGGVGIWTCIFTYEVTLEAAATPEQEAAFAKMDEWLPLIQNQALVTDPSFYTSNALQTNDGQGYAGLLDKNTTTFFHSQYNGTNPGTYHYLQANLSESVDGFYFYSYKRIQNNANRPTEILIQGSNDGENFDDITTVSGSQMVANDDYLSDKISASTGYQYIRFVVKATNTGAKFGDYVFFTYSEFWLLPSNETIDAAMSLMNGVSAANKLTDAQIAQINQIDEDLRNTMANVTYIVKDTDGNTLFTSSPQQVGKGVTITALPAEYQKTLFYTYNNVSVTVNSNTEIEFTATPKADAPFEFTADTSAPVWYNLTLSAAPNYVTYVAGGDQNVQLPTTLTDDETTQWAFIGNPYNGFQLVNKAAGTDLVLGSAKTTGSGNTGGNTYATLQSKGSQVNEVWTAKASTSISGKNGFFLFNTENHALNKRNGTANISYWTGGYDAGSTFVATKVLTDEEKYNELIALLESYELGDNLHEYGFEGYTTSEATTAISNLKAEGYTPENLTAAQNLAAAAKLNLPKAGMFLRIKSNAHGTYLSGVASTNPANRMTLTTDADANTIFYFDGNKMLTYGNGLYAKGRDVAKAIGDGEGSGEGVDYWFEESTITPAQYAIRFNPDGGTNRFLYAWGTDKNYADQNGADHANCVFTIEEVTELPITLHEATCKDGTTHWFATFSAPVAVSEVVGAEIHKVTDNGNSSTVKVEPAGVTGIPAGKAVLLVSDTETATVKLGETNDDDFDTALLPLYACEKGKAGFFFGKGGANEYAGFYTIGGETPTGGFKAYIAADSNGAKVLDFGNEATGINTIENGAENGAVYNLQGQRVNKAQKGVFIQNGKKVVLK